MTTLQLYSAHLKYYLHTLNYWFQLYVRVVKSAWSMEAVTWKVEWKFVWTMSGAQSAMMTGHQRMVVLFVDSWDSWAQVSRLYFKIESILGLA